jgi:homoserine dehydrogenase
VVASGDAVGTVMLIGRGAGRGPTASAVVADLVDIARGRTTPTFTHPAAGLAPPLPLPMAERHGAYYLRLMVVDQPGVIADVSAILRDHGVSMESFLQRGRAPGGTVPVVLVTHDSREEAMVRSLADIAALTAVVEPPRLIRIEAF